MTIVKGDAYLLRQYLDLRDDEAQSKESRQQFRGICATKKEVAQSTAIAYNRVDSGRRNSTAHSLTKIEPQGGKRIPPSSQLRVLLSKKTKKLSAGGIRIDLEPGVSFDGRHHGPCRPLVKHGGRGHRVRGPCRPCGESVSGPAWGSALPWVSAC